MRGLGNSTTFGVTQVRSRMSSRGAEGGGGPRSVLFEDIDILSASCGTGGSQPGDEDSSMLLRSSSSSDFSSSHPSSPLGMCGGSWLGSWLPPSPGGDGGLLVGTGGESDGVDGDRGIGCCVGLCWEVRTKPRHVNLLFFARRRQRMFEA